MIQAAEVWTAGRRASQMDKNKMDENMKEERRIEEKVFRYIKEHDMLTPGGRVIVGVSGGADSVCLLFVLMKWAEYHSLSLAAVHVNHEIRQEAWRDEEYVGKLCRDYNIPFFPVKADVRRKARAMKISEEEAGRLVRYEAFGQAAESFGAQRIAVAHNANDRAETMLFHLFRGTGLTGLCSIRPVRGQIIRPILCLERREVEEYLKSRGIPFCSDHTNEEDDYTRNRIRHHILPFAESGVAQGCVSHMGQTADMLAETEDYLGEQTCAARRSCVRQMRREDDSGGIVVDVSCMLGLHMVIRRRLLYLLLKELSPGQKDISYVHIQDVLELFQREGNRGICLPWGIRCAREYDVVILKREAEVMADRDMEGAFPGKCVIPGEIPPQGLLVRLPGDREMEFTVFSREKTENIPQNRYTKWFDYDKIKKSLVIRPRRSGDYLTIRRKDQEQPAHKPVKDFMIGEKIPRERRDDILLLTEDDHVLWVSGYRISEYYKISENTKRILQVQLRGSRESGGMEETNGGTNQGAVE